MALAWVLALAVMAPGVAWAAEVPPTTRSGNERAAPEETKAREEARARKERRDRPEERAARKKSRSEHHGLSRAEARKLARSSFDGALALPVWEPLSLRPGERFDSYVNDYAARIQRDGKAPLVAKTFAPMRAADAQGVKRRVDLGLVSEGTVVKSRNAGVKLSIAKDARGGVRFDKTAIRVAPVGLDAVDGEIVEDRVMAENVATDLDQIIAPTAQGAQYLWQLRSADSPESVRLRFAMPAGAKLRLEQADTVASAKPDKGAAEAVVVRDGQVLVRVDAPVVLDADGEGVASWYEVDGDDLVMRFPHRDQDVKYPLLADPQVVEGFGDPDWGSDGWAFNETPNQPIPFFSARNCCGRPGLQVATYASGDYNEGAVGQWTWTSYPDSYIERADFGGLDSEMTYGIDEHMLFTGLYSPGRGAYTSQIFQTGNFVGQTHNHPSVPGGAADENNLAVFGMKAFSVPNRDRYGLVAMRAAVLYLGDRRPPTVESSEQSYDTSQWTNADTASVRLRAHDDGLGLAAIGVARVILVGDQYWLGLHTPPCTGDRRGRCQTDFDTANDANFPTGRMQYRLDTLPEGLTELHASAHEISGGQYGTPAFAPAWTAKIDRTPPTVTPSGELYDLREQYLNGQGTRALTVTASDALSGVASVDVEDIGRGNIAHQTISCSATQCPTQATQTFNIDTSQLAEGRHQLRAVTTDMAGNRLTSSSWIVLIDRAAPYSVTQINVTGGTDGNASVTWSPSVDPASNDASPGSGAAAYTFRYRVGAGAWSTPSQTTDTSVSIASVAVGQTITVELTSSDRVGNVSSASTATVPVEAAESDPCDAGDLPVECSDDGGTVDAEADSSINLDPDRGGGSVGAQSTSATLYHLRTMDSGCAHDRCFATIRNKPQSWAVGNVRLEYPGADDAVTVTSTIRRIASDNSWHLGSLNQYSNRCAWVSGSLLAGGTASSSGCDDPGYRPDFKLWQAKPFGGRRGGDLVRGNNCFNASGTYRRPGAGTCDRGTAIYLVGPTVECANVYVIPSGTTRDGCAREDVVRTLNQSSEWSGYCVNWRYVTRDRKWVMVRDPRRLNRGGWVFIRLGSLASNRGTWPSYDHNDDPNRPATCPAS